MAGSHVAVIIGDGVPDALKAALRELVAEDHRFRFVDRPKHVRLPLDRPAHVPPVLRQQKPAGDERHLAHLGDLFVATAHGVTTDRLLAVSGSLLIALYDARRDSRTHRLVNEFRCGLARPTLILVPPGVWHGVHNIGHEPAARVNMVDRACRYEDPDHWRLPAGPAKFRTVSATRKAPPTHWAEAASAFGAAAVAHRGRRSCPRVHCGRPDAAR